MTAAIALGRGKRRWLPWIGGLVGIVALALVLRRLDLDRFLTVLASADVWLLALVPLTVMAEQLVRGWKWRQLLYNSRPTGSLRLFGAIMAGYLLATIVPFGFGTVARSWLVARREDLTLAAVLATVALDRLTDAIVFACLVPVALMLVAFPDPGGSIRAGLTWGAVASFVILAPLLVVLSRYGKQALSEGGWLTRLVARLPSRFEVPVRRLSTSFAEGGAWPRQIWRGISVVLASVVIKLFAATHFLWAGLALGVVLRPGQYLFLIVFLGFLVILGHFARVAGSFVIGAVFVLALFGVAEEEALAMVLVVEASNVLSVAGVGALSLWRQGVALSGLRTVGVDDATR